jgi:quercetin dioxygenase-like cupin family protein
MPAILHFLSGDASVTLGPDQIKTRAGAWIHMPAGLRHSIRADNPVVMLLILLKGGNVRKSVGCVLGSWKNKETKRWQHLLAP